MNPKSSQRLAAILALAVLAGPIPIRAQAPQETAAARFSKKLDALQAACQAERKQLGIKGNEALYRSYPTPEITLTRPLSVPPGGTAELVLPRQKAASVLFEADELSVEKESSGPSGYRATIRASASAGPGSAVMHVYAPVSCATDQRTVFVGGRYQWDLTAGTGLRIQVRTVEERLGGGEQPSLVCKANFTRAGEKTPFISRDMVVSLPRLPDREYAFSAPQLKAAPPSAADEEKMKELMMKLADPSVSPRERARASQEIARVSQAYQAEVERTTGGCTHIMLELGAAGAVKGEAQCQGGASVPVSGTMRLAAK